MEPKSDGLRLLAMASNLIASNSDSIVALLCLANIGELPKHPDTLLRHSTQKNAFSIAILATETKECIKSRGQISAKYKLEVVLRCPPLESFFHRPIRKTIVRRLAPVHAPCASPMMSFGE